MICQSAFSMPSAISRSQPVQFGQVLLMLTGLQFFFCAILHNSASDPCGWSRQGLSLSLSECWQGHVQAVEEVPSSSASSVAPSAATTPAAAMTAALIQEFNDGQESGWIFGVMGRSVASVTTGTDNLWDELVLDSGSVSTACPCAWCSDISLNQGWYLLNCGAQKVVLSAESNLMLQMLHIQLCHWER